MTGAIFINLAYVAAAILFIFGIKMLGSAATARRGNLISSLGMLLAVVVTLLDQNILGYRWLILCVLIGVIIGSFAARFVKMTGMPELVALFNGFGGLASLLVGWAEYEKIKEISWMDYHGSSYFYSSVIYLAVLIGGITFTGSLLAYGKLSEKIGSKAVIFPGQMIFNTFIFVIIMSLGIYFVIQPESEYAYKCFLIGVSLSLLLGVLGVLPIGGGDMPVVISFLNSFSGLAAAAAGFVILNNVLIVAGCLVGSAGFVLTVIMCKAMNRGLANVLFSGFGSASQAESQGEDGEMKAISEADAYYVLEAAHSVVIIPGYGMAVAQAQHAVKELGDILEKNGAEVRYAIHPVAGRMPGHMNVLLAEADVPYEQLHEMDSVNSVMPTVDVAIVIGANDVVNPAAIDDTNSPIYGMPIINAHVARTVFALKRGQGTGFSGIQNKLYFLDKTRMLFGDAKKTVGNLVSEFSER
jgi:NAD(P) transhydrogenase subunit beta